MFKKLFFLILIVSIALSACGTLEVSLDQTPTAGVDAGQVATMVAATLAAIPSATAMPEPTAAFTPEAPSVLPSNLYYLAKDANGKNQIYSLGRDGVTVTQITSEVQDVLYFDVSTVDETLVYSLSNGGIVIMNTSGRDRRVLADDLTFHPFWSPDGKTVAYSAEGNVYLYTFATGSATLLLDENETETFGLKGFSPDGKKLIVTSINRGPTAPTEGDLKIYDFESKKLTSIVWWENLPPCSDKYISWSTPDTFFCFFSINGIGVILPGLWRVDANTGAVEALFASRRAPFLLVGAPRQDSTGNLYYLYGEDDGIFGAGRQRGTLSLVRSRVDDPANRTVLRTETFQVLDSIWTPNNRGLVLFQGDGDRLPKDLLLLPIDPSQPVLTLLGDASTLVKNSLRWGP